jgi:hypothetical protein
MNDTVEIATYGSTFAARAAAAHLESEGIQALVITDNAGGAFPSMSGLSGGVRLLVSGNDAERASQILTERHTLDEVEDAEESADRTEEESKA